MTRKKKLRISDEVEVRYQNWTAQLLSIMMPWALYWIAGRASAKTTQVLAERVQEAVMDCSGAPFCWCSDTYSDLHKNVIEFLDSIEDITVVSPSNYVKDLWKEAFPKMEKKILVMGHKILCGKYEENNTPIKSNEKIKVAFVGKGVVRKGYYEWLDVVDKINCNDDLKKKYDFYHFGFSKETRDYSFSVTLRKTITSLPQTYSKGFTLAPHLDNPPVIN